jgi:hypothetical protein
MDVENRYLFNFAASYSGGGYKRLYEYAKWFNANSGAGFVVHENCRPLLTEFPNNRFFVVRQSRLDRLRNDCGYLAAIGNEFGQPELYYSYGIPVYRRFGRINWFHLSNVLPLAFRGIPVPLADRLRLRVLGSRIRNALSNADVVSAESRYALGLIPPIGSGSRFVSVNGSDDEINGNQATAAAARDEIATVVGTNSHKALDDTFRVFDVLRRSDPGLKLEIIGNSRGIPRHLRRDLDVVVRGLLTRSEVVNTLRRSKYYISTTLIENSYNAASEGIFIADESYISDIGPHRELLLDMKFDQVSIPNLGARMLHVKRDDLSTVHLKTWATVIGEMVGKFRDERQWHDRASGAP